MKNVGAVVVVRIMALAVLVLSVMVIYQSVWGDRSLKQEIAALRSKNRKLIQDCKDIQDEADKQDKQLTVETQVHPKKLAAARDLLDEYLRADAKLATSVSGREAETAEWKEFVIFHQLYLAYNDLTEAEKNAFVACEGKKLNFRFHSYDFDRVRKVPFLASGNSREEFEEFLGNAYFEVDYLSAFSIFKNGSYRKIEKEEKDALKEQGLLINPS